MSETFQIRLATADEYEEIGELTVRGYRYDGFLSASEDYASSLRDAASRAVSAELWVAAERATGRLLGSVTFCPLGSPYRELATDDEGEFRMLAVDPAARGRGVGRALVELCLRRSRELGYAGVRMSSMDRMTSAHRVYERLGFVRAPEDDWSPTPGVLLLAYVLAF